MTAAPEALNIVKFAPSTAVIGAHHPGLLEPIVCRSCPAMAVHIHASAGKDDPMTANNGWAPAITDANAPPQLESLDDIDA